MKVTVTYPESWADIKLEQYLQFYKQTKPYVGTDEYVKKLIEFGAYHFCNIDPTALYQLPASALTKISNIITELTTNTQLPIVKSFSVDETEYGFIPNIEEISYGEYLDLVEYFKDMWTYMPIIMSILYRPITKKFAGSYLIEPYNGTNDARIELFKHVVTMDMVFGATAFFLDLQKDLLIGTQTYLQEMLKKIQKGDLIPLQDLEKNGVDITQLQFLQEMTFQNLITLQNSPSTNA